MFLIQSQKKFKDLQSKSKIECELCGGSHKVEQCPHERKFSLGMDTTSSDTKIDFLMVRVKV